MGVPAEWGEIEIDDMVSPRAVGKADKVEEANGQAARLTSIPNPIFQAC